MSQVVHANCLLLDDAGLLIRGASGAGKSLLARRLVTAWTARGRFACQVADDRVAMRQVSGRVIASPHPMLAGLHEIRNIGIVSVPFEEKCVIRGVVDLVSGQPERMPEDAVLFVEIMGVLLPRLVMPNDVASLEKVETFWKHTIFK